MWTECSPDVDQVLVRCGPSTGPMWTECWEAVAPRPGMQCVRVEGGQQGAEAVWLDMLEKMDTDGDGLISANECVFFAKKR